MTKAEAERRRPNARARGYDGKWEKARKAFLAEPRNRVCVCGCGCGRLADAVDHIVPHRGDRKLFWDRPNWEAMTKSCHDRKTAREDGRWGGAGQNSAPLKNRTGV